MSKIWQKHKFQIIKNSKSPSKKFDNSPVLSTKKAINSDRFFVYINTCCFSCNYRSSVNDGFQLLSYFDTLNKRISSMPALLYNDCLLPV